jgi:hypothetical protein
MKRQASLIVIAAACAALLAGPAFAQMSSGGGGMQGMKMSSAPKKTMRMAKAHAMKHTCMDYAWQSQDQKDCEAGKVKPPR